MQGWSQPCKWDLAIEQQKKKCKEKKELNFGHSVPHKKKKKINKTQGENNAPNYSDKNSPQLRLYPALCRFLRTFLRVFLRVLQFLCTFLVHIFLLLPSLLCEALPEHHV